MTTSTTQAKAKLLQKQEERSLSRLLHRSPSGNQRQIPAIFTKNSVLLFDTEIAAEKNKGNHNKLEKMRKSPMMTSMKATHEN